MVHSIYDTSGMIWDLLQVHHVTNPALTPLFIWIPHARNSEVLLRSRLARCSKRLAVLLLSSAAPSSMLNVSTRFSGWLHICLRRRCPPCSAPGGTGEAANARFGH